MRLIISGHRRHKLEEYNYNWIERTVEQTVLECIKTHGISLAYSGMASGVDIMFCNACFYHKLPYIACVPFDGQENTMTPNDAILREEFLGYAKEIKKVKNSWMVENCDVAIVVFDGTKGGTHNVFQQLIEKKIDFYWINPVSQVVWKCFKEA